MAGPRAGSPGPRHLGPVDIETIIDNGCDK